MPLPIKRAIELITFVENEYASGKNYMDAYVPFDNAGANMRLEALISIYITIADYFQKVKASKDKKAMQEFETYAHSSD